ncbi:uncharacterized protein LOC128205894 [Mya arenaria]|uniref:uncharacterized protein LOC128205894 n=1 Tax=Mya arenaria TaxID=6604 RepID=UPI0022DF388E|nr:uncharacterized protein LOC128205894 [Mya arenaria]
MTQTELDCDVKGNAIDEEENVGAVDTDSFLPVPETELKGVKDLLSTVPDDEEAVDYKQLDLCHRLRVDHLFRRRFIHSFWLFWSCFGLGWMVGLYGPSFADLRQIVNQDLEAGSWLFTTAGIGYLVGSLLGGILFDRFNKLLIIGVSCVTMAVFTGFQPWCRSYPLMLALRFLSGLGGGGLDTGANADMVSIWDEEGRPYMQAMHASFGAGGIVAPLVIEPFLSEKILENVTNGNTSELVTVYGETNIHSAFLISLAVILTGALPFFYMYFRICCCGISHKMAAKKIDHKRPAKLPTDLRDIIHELQTAKRARFETATPVTGTQSTCTQVNTMNAPPASHVAQPSGAPTSAATFSATSYSDALPMRYSDVQAAQSQSPEFTTPLVNQAHCEQGTVLQMEEAIVTTVAQHSSVAQPTTRGPLSTAVTSAPPLSSTLASPNQADHVSALTIIVIHHYNFFKMELAKVARRIQRERREEMLMIYK